MKSLLSFFIVLLLSAELSAQDCNCNHNLESLVRSVEDNYSGYEDKVLNHNQASYISFRDSLIGLSTSKRGYDCYSLLKEYLSYFKDPHMAIRILKTDPAYADTIKQFFTGLEKRSFDLGKLYKYWNGKGRNNIEGIWEAEGFPFKMAIYEISKGKYIGIALEADGIFWQPGQVKLEITGPDELKYYDNEHSLSSAKFQLEHNTLYIAGQSTWKKTYPTSSTTDGNSTEVSFKVLSKDFNLLTISSFNISYKASLDSIVKANDSIIKHSKYLIIDLRNNAGGHYMTYDTLLPLLYTRPIIKDGSVIRASKDNIDVYRRAMANPNYSEDAKAGILEIITTLEKSPGKMVKISEGDTIKLPKTESYPQKIAILVNGGTTSAAELFLFAAQQSDKVTIFGTNTRGALDYAELGERRKLPCPYLGYTCPMGKSEHKIYPYIDNAGIAPDVRIPAKQSDWIKFVIINFKTKQ